MSGHATALGDWIVILPVLLGLSGAALLLVLRRLLPVQPWIAAVMLLAMLLVDGALLRRVMAEGPLSMTMGNWLPPFGISFTADAMGAGFALLAAFVALAVLLYLWSDAPESAVRDGLYPLLLLLVAGVSGAFLTGDLFNLYVWFEVMLIASFGLMVLAGNPLQLDGTVKYGILNIVATTLFLLALGLLYGLLGTLNMADIIGAARRADTAPLVAVASLLALAFGAKAALFPVNAWLPASYHTPPAAISALVGALLTKVGAYAFLRTLVMLMPEAREVMAPVIGGVAIAGMLAGPLAAIAETNLRRAAGFILIGGMGNIVAVAALSGTGIGLDQGAGLAGAIAYIGHAVLSLAALYLVCGLVEQTTGRFDSRDMGGLSASRPLLAWLFLVLVLSLAGIPPFLGFWPKLLLLQGFLVASGLTGAVRFDPLALGLSFALLGNALLTLIAGTRLWSHVFWRPREGLELQPARGYGATVLLTGTVVLLGLMPNVLLSAAGIAARDVLDPARYIAAVGLAP